MIPSRRIDGVEIFPIGLGAVPMSVGGRPEEGSSVRTVHAALDAGVDLIDRADEARGRVEAVSAIAGCHGVSPQQVALVWLMSRGETVVPIPGASRPETVRDSLAAAGLELSEDELAAIGEAG